MEEILTSGPSAEDPDILPAAGMPPSDVIAEYSPLALAFLGDAVYELEVRGHIVRQGNSTPKKLTDKSSFFSRAHTQAILCDLILPDLSDEEADILRRGRNANVNTVPKHASHADYHKATSVEALFGYLYLTGRMDRVRELMQRVWSLFEGDNNGI